MKLWNVEEKEKTLKFYRGENRFGNTEDEISERFFSVAKLYDRRHWEVLNTFKILRENYSQAGASYLFSRA